MENLNFSPLEGPIYCIEYLRFLGAALGVNTSLRETKAILDKIVADFNKGLMAENAMSISDLFYANPRRFVAEAIKLYTETYLM